MGNQSLIGGLARPLLSGLRSVLRGCPPAAAPRSFPPRQTGDCISESWYSWRWPPRGPCLRRGASSGGTAQRVLAPPWASSFCTVSGCFQPALPMNFRLATWELGITIPSSSMLGGVARFLKCLENDNQRVCDCGRSVSFLPVHLPARALLPVPAAPLLCPVLQRTPQTPAAR